jgi:hypothetical protein
MRKSKKPLHLNSINSNPTTGMDTGSVSSAVSKDGEHIYVSNGEKIPYEDGFRICVGQEKAPLCNDLRSTFTHISQDRWDAIFGKKG